MQFATYLPTTFNDGRKVPRKVLIEIRDEASRLFGGYTLSGPVMGNWRNDSGEVFNDRSYLLTVVCDDSLRAEAEAFVIRTGVTLKQEAMYFELRNSEVHFLTVPKSTT